MVGHGRRNAVVDGFKEVERYMQDRDIPKWFRGISSFQCNAATGLFEALLYDGEQHSTHRVKECLVALGLQPMISKEQIKFLMSISKGSDLAFLWFLLESYYKTKGPGYSINEQIIYSCIAHLDMVTTLRELDRLLPHNPPKEKKPIKKTKQVIVVKSEQFKQFKFPKDNSSPYMEDIKTQNLNSNSLVATRPNHRVFLSDYEVYKDPSYVVANESVRWFATYKTKTSRRIAGRILRDEIERVLKDVHEISKDIAEKLILCHYHKSLVEAEIRQKKEKEEKACAAIRNYFDVDGVKERSTKDRILAEMGLNIKMFMQKYRYDAEKINANFKDNKKPKIEVLAGTDSIKYCEPKITEEFDCKKDENENGECSCKEEATSAVHYCVEHHRDGVQRRTRASAPKDCAKDDQFFFIHKPTQGLWHFDYRKIFNTDISKNTPEQEFKLTFAKALNSQAPLKPDLNGNVDVEKAFNKGFKKQWAESVQKYNRKVELEARMKKLDEGEVPIRFDRDYFDPNDEKYLVYMLKCCFDRMKKNPKFVLASMPEGHKLPMLIYFIMDRYGKRYSLQEHHRLFAQSLQILRALDQQTKSAPTPRFGNFAKTPNRISYACRHYLLAKSEQFRKQYYEELDQIIMHKARIFWISMRPFLFPSGPPRNTYFAYMPARTVDLTRFRQWRPMEFMDAKKQWDRRQREARVKRF